MKCFINKDNKNFFIVLVTCVAVAMIVGSFAMGESRTVIKTPSSPQSAKTQSAATSNTTTAGPFTIYGGTQGNEFSYTSPVLTIHKGELTISTASQTAERIVVDGGATITLANVNIKTDEYSALQIQDNATFDVRILLADGSENILETNVSYNCAGLQKNDDGTVSIDNLGTLTIGVPNDSTGTGKLVATGGNLSAGIGSACMYSTNNIVINRGNIIANGGTSGPGIGGGNGSHITINGGEVDAYGGYLAAGIGGGDGCEGKYIKIGGGVVTAIGGECASGIGGGNYGNGSDITINGNAVVTAIGRKGAAGIGGGLVGEGNDITISGGVIKAIGGVFEEGTMKLFGAGMGGGTCDPSGQGGGASGNSLSGNAMVFAASGDLTGKAALQGFENEQGESLLNQGIAFVGEVTDYTIDPINIDWKGGEIYGNTTLLNNLEIPVTLTVPAEHSLIISQGVTLTVPARMTLQNDGTITVNNTGIINCQGEITTKTDFYLQDDSLYTTGYQTYQTNEGVQKYKDLPSFDNYIHAWYTQKDGNGKKVNEALDVLVNQHNFYEYESDECEITITQPENGTLSVDADRALEGAEITITATPDEGYQLKEGSLTVTDADGNEVPVTEQDGKYTFTMPDSEVEISAVFELIPEPEPIPDPSVEPGHGGDGSDASSKTGDSFAGTAALAIIGLSTTGAVMLRKRK